MAQSQSTPVGVSTMRKRMNLGALFVDEVVVHDVPKQKPGEHLDELPATAFSTAPTELTDELRLYFREKLTGSLSRAGIDIVPNSDVVVSPVPPLVHEMIEGCANGGTLADHIERTQDIARHLFASQTATNPAGLLVVVRARIEKASAIAILKLEREDALRLEPVEKNGMRSFTIKHLEDLMLGKNTRLFKSALFQQPGTSVDSLKGMAADDQRPISTAAEVARFFLHTFLGCKIAEDPAIVTERFFNASQGWINQLDLGEKRARYEIALLAEMNRPVDTFRPTSFGNQHVDVEDRDAFRAWMRTENFGDRALPKDVARIKPRLGRMTVHMAEQDIRISGSPDAVAKNVTVIDDNEDGHGPHVRVSGPVGEVRGGR